MAVAADLIDAPIDLEPVIIGIAKFDGDLTTGAAPAGKVDLDPMPAQMVVRPHDLIEGGHLEGDMVEVGIRRRLFQRTDQRDPVMVRVAAQKHHAARHHLLGIDVRDLQPEELGVEPGRPLHVAHVEHDMTKLADPEGVTLEPTQLPYPVRIIHFVLQRLTRKHFGRDYVFFITTRS